MSICGDHMIYLHYYGKHMLAHYSMNLPKSHGSFYFKVKMSSLTPLSSSYQKPKKLAEKRLDIYKLMVEESLLA